MTMRIGEYPGTPTPASIFNPRVETASGEKATLRDSDTAVISRQGRNLEAARLEGDISGLTTATAGAAGISDYQSAAKRMMSQQGQMGGQMSQQGQMGGQMNMSMEQCS